MWKENLKWLQSQLSVIKSTGVASGSVAVMSLYVGNFVWVEAAHTDLQSIVVLCLFSTFSVMKTFVSSHLIPFPLSTIAEPHWLVVVMACLVKEPLLIGLLVFVWCSKQCDIICRRSALIQTPQPFMELSSPKHFNCFYNWVCLLPLWLPWISLLLSNKAITAKSHIFTKKCLFAQKLACNYCEISFQFSACVRCLASPYMCSWELTAKKKGSYQ